MKTEIEINEIDVEFKEVTHQSEQLFCDACNTKMNLVDNNSYYKCNKCGQTRAK